MTVEMITKWLLEWVPSDCWSDYQVGIGLGNK